MMIGVFPGKGVGWRTRESVNMALSDFRRRGLVVLESRAFRLPRPERLQELQ
jgi:hypothetical protein